MVRCGSSVVDACLDHCSNQRCGGDQLDQTMVHMIGPSSLNEVSVEVTLFLLWQLAHWWALCTKECCLLVVVQVHGTRSQGSSLVLLEIVKVMAALEEEEVALAEIP